MGYSDKMISILNKIEIMKFFFRKINKKFGNFFEIFLRFFVSSKLKPVVATTSGIWNAS